MANPLDGLTRVYITGEEPRDDNVVAFPSDVGMPVDAPTNALTRAVSKPEPTTLEKGLAALKQFVENFGTDFGLAGVEKTHPQRAELEDMNKALLGIGRERYQMWPERMVRSGFTLPGDVASGAEPVIDPSTGRTSIPLIERAQDTAGLAFPGALTQRPGTATLGSGPVRPTAAARKTPVFYSAVEHAVTNAAQDTMSPQQWAGFLKNQPGVKGEELAWTGLGDWLAGQKGNVKKSDVQRYLDEHKIDVQDVTRGENTVDMVTARKVFEEANERPPRSDNEVRQWIRDTDGQAEGDNSFGVPRYSDYQLPGGENYREHLLTLPPRGISKEAFAEIQKAERAAGNVYDRLHGKMYDKYGAPGDFANNWLSKATPEEMAKFKAARAKAIAATEELVKAKEKVDGQHPEYQSSHWEEPNVLAHIRTNEREFPIPFTAEEEAARNTRAAVQSQIEAIRQQQGEVARQINAMGKPLEKARIAAIIEDVKSGKITSTAEYHRRMEAPGEFPELVPLQDKLQALRAQEDNLRASLPPEPKQRSIRSLHIEEIQSDWHQQGRKQGYKENIPVTDEIRAISKKLGNGRNTDPLYYSPRDIEIGEAKGLITPNEAQKFADFIERAGRPENIKGVPDAPFKTSWPELSLKRMIRMAADEGKTRISWTPGEAQAARYDLSKQIDQLKYLKNNDGTYNLVPFKGNKPIHAIERANVNAADLPGIIGKDVADKIVKGEGTKEGDIGVLQGLDLKVGGEGMKGFYDNMLPKMVEKLGKQHGVKVQKGSVPIEGGNSDVLAQRAGVTRQEWEAMTPKERVVEMKKMSEPVWYFDIPPAWRDQALGKGFPLYMQDIPFPLTPVDYDPFKRKDQGNDQGRQQRS